MDSHPEDPNADTIHISEEPRREHVLPLDEGGQQFTISLDGISVAQFYAFRGVLYQEHAKRFKVLGPTDSWIFGELILTNQGGTWVLTAPSNSPLLLAYGRLSTEECAQLYSAEKKLPIEPVDCRQFLTRASLALIIGAGVAWGLNEWVDWDAFSSDVERQMIEMIRQVHRGVGLTNY